MKCRKEGRIVNRATKLTKEISLPIPVLLRGGGVKSI